MIQHRLQLMVNEVVRLQPARVVDYAAQTPNVLLAIREALPDAWLFATDIDDQALKVIRNNRIACAQVDHELPHTLGGAFDVAIAGEIIEHLLSPDAFLESVNRNLTPGGHFICSIPNCANPASLAAQIFLDYPPMFAARYRSTHVREYTIRLIKAIFRAHGFRVLRVYGCEIPGLPMWTSRITRIFPRLGRHIIIVSRRVADPNRALVVDQSHLCRMSDVEDYLRQHTSEAA